MFLGYIPTLLFEVNSPNSNNACAAFARFPGAMNTISLGIITIFLVLRTYAIYLRRSWVLVVTIPLGIVNVVLAAWSVTKAETFHFTFGTGALNSCVPELLLSTTPFKASWTITIAFDTLISVLTICKTYRMHRENRQVDIESRLVDMLLQDGSLYYSVMTVANVINFVLFCAESFDFIEGGAGNSSELTHSISVIIVSRAMLNLMEAVDPLSGDDNENNNINDHTEGRPNLSTFQFTTQNSVASTGPLCHSAQLPFEPADTGAV